MKVKLISPLPLAGSVSFPIDIKPKTCPKSRFAVALLRRLSFGTLLHTWFFRFHIPHPTPPHILQRWHSLQSNKDFQVECIFIHFTERILDSTRKEISYEFQHLHFLVWHFEFSWWIGTFVNKYIIQKLCYLTQRTKSMGQSQCTIRSHHFLADSFEIEIFEAMTL